MKLQSKPCVEPSITYLLMAVLLLVKVSVMKHLCSTSVKRLAVWLASSVLHKLILQLTHLNALITVHRTLQIQLQFLQLHPVELSCMLLIATWIKSQADLTWLVISVLMVALPTILNKLQRLWIKQFQKSVWLLLTENAILNCSKRFEPVVLNSNSWGMVMFPEQFGLLVLTDHSIC